LSQRICPRNIHGIVVYQTKSEMESLDELEQGSLAVFFAGLLVLGFEEMRWKKRQGTASQVTCATSNYDLHPCL